MVTTELTSATTPSPSARSISAVAPGSVATSAQPGATTTDPFGALMDQLGSEASAPAITVDPTAKTTPAVTPTTPPPGAQATPPAQQTLVPLLPAQATASVANTTKQTVGTRDVAATTATTEDRTEDDEPTETTLVAMSAPQPPMPLPPQPQAVSPLTAPARTNDALLPTDTVTAGNGPQAAAGTTQGYNVQQTPVTASEDGSQTADTPVVADPADKPTNALVTAQAAVTPLPMSSPARSTGRIHDDGPVKTTSTSPKTDTQEAAQPVLELSSLLPVVTTALTAPLQTQSIPPTSPMPTPAAQPIPNQAASIAPTQSVRVVKTESEPTAALSEPKSPAAAPDTTPSNTSNVTAAAPAPTATVTMSAPASPTVMAESARQVSTRPASPPGSPARQVAQAIVEPVKILMSSPDPAASTVSHITTIQIAPAELGRVDIRIERPIDGPATIQLIAERPETLSRLVHDQSQLQQALDQAGVPQAGRTLDFSLAPSTTPDFAGASSSAGGAMSGGSSSNNGQQRRAGTYANQAFGTVDDTAAIAMTPFRSIRTGIDITA